ncbi:plasmid pRiA4b ORF-3 family protein [Jeotgalibacillus malaysiensis]|uniref:plasmid pRiA4b ORF-3 family protein n=1 Tax=Jeotgalibacillus malaysiensis TaxID=1508404 RepID=UPI00384C1D0D
MILEVKVTLLGEERPVWRRLRIDDGMTFYEFHKILQVAFGWTESHLHNFDVRRSGGRTERTLIEMEETEDFFLTMDESVSEQEAIVGDWLIQPKDRALYVYDFGDYWEHEIVVEKVYPEKEGIQTPYCVKAMRTPPEEDSRWQVNDTERLNNTDMMNEINTYFEKGIESYFERLNHTYSGDALFETENDPESLTELMQAMKKLDQAAPWTYLDDDQIFAIDYGHSLYFASVMGSAGIEKGIALYEGRDGWFSIKAMLSGDADYLQYNQRGMLATFNDRTELEDEDYRLIKESGIGFRGKKKWPSFLSFHPGYYPWFLDVDEYAVLTDLIEEILTVTEKVKNGLNIVHPFNSGVIYLKVAGDWVEDEDRGVQVAEIERMYAKHAPVLNMILPDEMDKLKQYPKSDQHLSLGCLYSREAVQTAHGKRPFYPMNVFVYDHQTKQLNHIATYAEGYKPLLIQSALWDALKKKGALPQQLTVATKDWHYLKPILDELPVKVKKVERMKEMEGLDWL